MPESSHSSRVAQASVPCAPSQACHSNDPVLGQMDPTPGKPVDCLQENEEVQKASQAWQWARDVVAD